jgi:hypothetical protein
MASDEPAASGTGANVDQGEAQQQPSSESGTYAGCRASGTATVQRHTMLPPSGAVRASPRPAIIPRAQGKQAEKPHEVSSRTRHPGSQIATKSSLNHVAAVVPDAAWAYGGSFPHSSRVNDYRGLDVEGSPAGLTKPGRLA